MGDRFGLPQRARRRELVPDFVRQLPRQRRSGDAIAAFDADGTLWTDDVADDFTQWMIAEGHIDGARWPDYMRIYRDDPPTGCRFLLRFYRGMTRPALRQKIDLFWAHHAQRAWVVEVLEALWCLQDEQRYAIWIVSGTPTDFLLPLERILGVDRVVGMDFALDAAKRITGEPAGIPCAGEGKARKLQQLAGSRPILFCCGNGSLDGPMMELADVAWSVYPNPDFAEHSRRRGWPILPRPADFVEEEKFLLDD